MRNDTALSCYLLAPTQEEEVVNFCGEESPEEESVDNASTVGGGGRVHDLKGTEQDIECWLYFLR